MLTVIKKQQTKQKKEEEKKMANKKVETKLTAQETAVMKQNGMKEKFENFLKKVKKGTVKVGKNFGQFCSKILKAIIKAAKTVFGWVKLGAKAIWNWVKSVVNGVLSFFRSVKMGFKVIGFFAGIIRKFMTPAAASAIENVPDEETVSPVKVKAEAVVDALPEELPAKGKNKGTKKPISLDEKVKLDFSEKESNKIYDPGYVNEPLPGQA